jgi:hypothetical protein
MGTDSSPVKDVVSDGLKLSEHTTIRFSAANEIMASKPRWTSAEVSRHRGYPTELLGSRGSPLAQGAMT